MRRYVVGPAGLLVFITLGFILGCSTTHSLVKVFGSSEPVIAKRVKVVPFIDETHLGAHLGGEFTAGFVSRIRNMPSVILYEKPLGLSMPADLKSPRFGIVTPKNFIRKAEELGLNVLITGVLNPVDVTLRRSGIWPFRKNTRFYKVSMVVNLIDVSTGAVLFTRLESREFSGSEEEYADNEKAFMTELVKDHMPEILKKQVSVVSDVLARIPWIGKIISAEGQAIRMNGGRDVGIKQGYVFQVFSSGEWIQSLNGQSYPVRSQKVGEIEVVSLGDNDAIARPLSGGPFAIGQEIRIKD